MLFKSFKLFAFNSNVIAQQFVDAIENNLSEDLPDRQLKGYGFSYPITYDENVMYNDGGNLLSTSLKLISKLLPASVIKQYAQERIDIIEAQQGRALSKKDILNVTNEVIADLAPQAFEQWKKFNVAIDMVNHTVLIEGGNSEVSSIASKFNTEGIDLYGLNTVKRPAITMTQWLLNQQAPSDLIIEQNVIQLKVMEKGGGVLDLKNTNPYSSGIAAYLNDGYLVNKLSFSWDNKLAFTLDSSLNITGSRFLDYVLNEINDYQTGVVDKAARYNVEVSILVADVLRGFSDRLIQIFGGLNIDSQIQAKDADKTAIEKITINGTATANNLTDNTQDNLINAGIGNDTVTASVGNDTLNGGAGNDSLVGGVGDDVYIVDSTADKITELNSAGVDTIASGVNYVLPLNVEDLFLVGTSDIRGTGNAECNAIVSNGGDNTLFGGDGLDQLIGGDGNDSISGGNGTDYITSGDGNNKIDGGADADDITGGIGNDTIAGGSGDDVIRSFWGNDSVNGGDDNDTIIDELGLNSIDGGAGNDDITGGESDDVITGGLGNNRIDAGKGNDVITVTGNDTVYAGTGDDVIKLSVVGSAVVTFKDFLTNDTLYLQDTGLKAGALSSADFAEKFSYHDDDNAIFFGVHLIGYADKSIDYDNIVIV